MHLILLAALTTARGAQAPRPLPPPVAVEATSPGDRLVERYGAYLDEGLNRRLRGRALRRPELGESNAAILGMAVADASVDWSGWALRQAAGANPAAQAVINGPTVSVGGSGGGGGPKVRAGGDRPSRDVLGDAAPQRRSQPEVSLSVLPRLPRPDADNDTGLDASATLSARAVGVDEVRLTTRARQQKLTAMARQEVLRGMSVVVSADTLPHARALAEWTSGAMLRLTDDGVRVYTHYTRAFERRDQPSEHTVGLALSVIPDRSRARRR